MTAAAHPPRADGHLALGRWGERHAARWYERRGYEIIACNWRVPEGEIDLVVGRDGTIVFAEVKTRRTNQFGDPSLAVNADKQHRLRRLAVLFLRSNGLRHDRIRFDVVAVLGTTVRVIEGAF